MKYLPLILIVLGLWLMLSGNMDGNRWFFGFGTLLFIGGLEWRYGSRP